MVTLTSRTQIAIEIGTTLPNALLWPTRYAAASTRSICSVAYAVEESASEAKIASAVFLVSRSCAKRAVLIGLPTSRRFKEAIFLRPQEPVRHRERAKIPQRATLRKAPTVANRSPNGGLLLHCAKQAQACVRALYTASAFESQWADATRKFAG